MSKPRYICSDCGRMVKEKDYHSVEDEDGAIRWVCTDCYNDYPDDFEEDLKGTNLPSEYIGKKQVIEPDRGPK